MTPLAPLALILLQAQSPTNEALSSLAAEISRTRSELVLLAKDLKERDEKVLELRQGVHALRQDVTWLKERPAPSVAGPFLSAPPPSSDTVGVAKVAVFAPRLDIDAQRRHDIVFLKLRRVEAEGVAPVVDLELGGDSTSVDLPLDRNGSLYVVEWSTSQGHTYTFTLRDGTSGLPAATVQVRPLQEQGRFIFVGYRVE